MKRSMMLLTVSLGAVLACISAEQTTTQSEYLSPFTHTTLIPVSADLSSIRFSGIRLTRVATEIKLKEDQRYCNDVLQRDPGGSEFCPEVGAIKVESAYRVTYSYSATPLASDERSGSSFSFSIYFRPEELNDQQRKALSEGRRAAVAEYFGLTTFREMKKKIVINEASSNFCEGNYVDGTWRHLDPKCEDMVSLKTVAVPSNFVTVRLEVSQDAQVGASNP